MKTVIYTDHAPKPIGPYSQAVRVGPFLFCSGQIPIDPTSGQIVQGDVRAQAKQVMENIQAVLKQADLNFSDIVKTTIFLTDMKEFSMVNEVYGSFFKNNYPARSTVQVAALPLGVKVEIEILAYVQDV